MRVFVICSLTLAFAGCSLLIETVDFDRGSPDASTRLNDADPRTDAGLIKDAGALSPYAEAILSDHPLAYWRLEETAGTAARDETGNGHACTYGSDVTLGAPGFSTMDTGISLRGAPGGTNSKVACESAPFDFTGNRPFTIEAWIKPTRADGVYRSVLSRQAASGPRNGYALDVQGTDFFIVRYRDDTERCSVREPIALNKFTYVVGAFDGVGLSLYANGQLHYKDTPCGTDGLLSTKEPLYLGYFADYDGFFEGSIDEVAIYDFALTDARVLAHYQAAQGL